MKYDTRTRDLLRRLETLEKLYRDNFCSQDDLKALQGVERCIELRMKLLGCDAKQSAGNAGAVNTPEAAMSIDLSKLSENTINELLKLGKDGKTN